MSTIGPGQPRLDPNVGGLQAASAAAVGPAAGNLGGNTVTIETPKPSFLDRVGANFNNAVREMKEGFQALKDKMPTIGMPSMPKLPAFLANLFGGSTPLAQATPPPQTQHAPSRFDNFEVAVAPSGPPLPKVELESLRHLFLGANDVPFNEAQINFLYDQSEREFSSENLNFLQASAALLKFQNADASIEPSLVLKAELPAGQEVHLAAEMPVIMQWVERHVGDDAPEPVNIPSTMRDRLTAAVANIPNNNIADADVNQKKALVGAIRECADEIKNLITRDSLSRAKAHAGWPPN